MQNTLDLSSSVYFEELGAPNTHRAEVLCIGSTDNWMNPYIAYLKDGTLPEDQSKARYLKHEDAHFFLEDNQLYRRTFSAPTLKCVNPEEADYYLREVHEGICGDRLAAKSLSYKVIRQGYYWPTIHTDAVAYVKKCSKCQKFNNVPKQSPSLLEAKAMRTINQHDYIKFMDSIVMRFGISMVMISDNGPQFVGSDFKAYLKELEIKHKRPSVAHPQGNGQVEVTKGPYSGVWRKYWRSPRRTG
ncbi:uncharacterized protein LOC141685245 [Apium graveolens]|uniref:uncharacterized protein LOC141685245 n=1 Tax=Apium graveolens TaxID=4045 RepID=UPI003D7BFB6C